jgi:hypothetical protein
MLVRASPDPHVLELLVDPLTVETVVAAENVVLGGRLRFRWKQLTPRRLRSYFLFLFIFFLNF